MIVNVISVYFKNIVFKKTLVYGLYRLYFDTVISQFA